MSGILRYRRPVRLCLRKIGQVLAPIRSSRVTTISARPHHNDIDAKDANVSPASPAAERDALAPPTAFQPPLIYPEAPGSGKHYDLESFRQYTFRSGLDPTSTTYVGTHYEYTISEHLLSLGFDLKRVGGASDLGLDLLGVWSIPSEAWKKKHAPIRVFLQCKAGSGQRIGPHLVRELEGAFVGAPPGWRSRPEDARSGTAVIGLLVTEKPSTKGIRAAINRSHWPMIYMCCSNKGVLQQMIWNQRVEEVAGLVALGVAVRHVVGGEPHLALTWKGRALRSAGSGK